MPSCVLIRTGCSTQCLEPGSCQTLAGGRCTTIVSAREQGLRAGAPHHRPKGLKTLTPGHVGRQYGLPQPGNANVLSQTKFSHCSDPYTGLLDRGMARRLLHCQSILVVLACLTRQVCVLAKHQQLHGDCLGLTSEGQIGARVLSRTGERPDRPPGTPQ